MVSRYMLTILQFDMLYGVCHFRDICKLCFMCNCSLRIDFEDLNNGHHARCSFLQSDWHSDGLKCPSESYLSGSDTWKCSGWPFLLQTQHAHLASNSGIQLQLDVDSTAQRFFNFHLIFISTLSGTLEIHRNSYKIRFWRLHLSSLSSEKTHF